MGNFNETLGINDLKSKNNLWRALLAEFIGNLLLNFFICISCVVSSDIMISLTAGFIVFIVVQSLGHVSGAHLNPAITAGMLAAGNVTIIKGVLYIIVQCIGAIAGSAIVRALTQEVKDAVGVTLVHGKLNEAHGFGIEYFLGFVLVLTVFGVCDVNRPEAKPAAALAIGMAVAMGHVAAIGLTGASMNPARSFGAALINGDWSNHWVYWVGPITGGVSAALLYKHAFSAPSLGPVKIIERYTTVSADEKEVPNI
ncbi:aquaporin transporter [Holotrichia oblita]|uniref:Aquaporin transporter n=1 Tax=Holotrichia oblita TaxID=644536 RepID=A0ACB9SXV1_HOLOL|nr:aquaporin transporter [Holotrichia oblita]